MGTLIALFFASFVCIVFGSVLLDAAGLAELLERSPIAGMVLLAVVVAAVIYFYLKLSDKNKALEKRIDELEFQLKQLKKK